jgi:hypothetical protein
LLARLVVLYVPLSPSFLVFPASPRGHLTFQPSTPPSPPKKIQLTSLFTAKFLPATLIQTDLTSHHGANLSSLSFPPSIQSAFVERFNLQLHVAFIFYIIALVWVGIVIAWGMLACWVGVLGSFAVLFTSVRLYPFFPTRLASFSNSEIYILSFSIRGGLRK